MGFNVPYTTVISRNVAPFSFGKETGLKEKWIHTAPVVKEPGTYYTGDKWIDPFILMQNEESKGNKEINISAILSQNAVEAIYSGGAIVAKNKENDIIEGVIGKGDDFMLGVHKKSILPSSLLDNLKVLLDNIREYYSMLGEVSIEWVFDGVKIWILQLNQIGNLSGGHVIVSGNPLKYETFFVGDGLEQLRNRIKEIEDKGIGIELIGDVGLCSHFGDVLRQANIPSFINRNK